MSDLAKRLRNWTTDWDGSKMVPGEPPKDGLHCDIIDEAAEALERLAQENERLAGFVDKYRRHAQATIARAEAAEARVAELEAGRGVVVKPLEWDKHPDADYDPKCNEHYGGGQENLAGVNEYDIFPHPCADDMFVLDVMGRRVDDDFSSVEAAKAAAQADYEARILSAITKEQDA